MQVKFLKSVVEDLINKQAVPIIDLLIGKKNVNEFLIAKKLKLTINQTRNILYKLSDFGLVSFIRKKDKRKGWYIYFWTLNVFQSLNLLEKKMRKDLEQLESQLKSRMEKRYFICNTCSIEVSEESALLNDFACPECEEVYQLRDNKEMAQQLEKEIVKLKKEIELVSFERQKEQEKLDKKKERKIKTTQIKEKAARKEKREERKKEKKKEEKKIEREKEGRKQKRKKAIKKKIVKEKKLRTKKKKI